MANAGDCRAVLCRKGRAVPMSVDHDPTSLLEKKRIESAGGYVSDGYVNGQVTMTYVLATNTCRVDAPIIAHLRTRPRV